jgi:hypothetical protein
MDFERRDNGHHVAEDDEGNIYGLMMQPVGGWIVMRNERAVGSAPDLATAKAEARNHRAILS